MSAQDLSTGCDRTIAPAATVALVIPTYRRDKTLLVTLRDVLLLSPAPDEVLVIDQTPEHDRDTAAFLQKACETKQIAWIRQATPSLCQARNQALALAKSDWVVYCDDDVLLPSDWFGKYRQQAAGESAAAFVGETYQVERFADWMLDKGALGKIATEQLPHYGREHESNVDFLRGCNFMVRRSAAIAAGGFEEALFGSVYGDEMDFALRLLGSGGNIRFLADAWLVHLSAPAGGCRIVGNTHVPEWQKTYCSWLLFFRHRGRRRSYDNLYGGRVLPFLWSILRAGPLRRENVLSPRRWYGAWEGLVIAGWRGYRAARSAVKSPFSAIPSQ